MDSFQDGRGGAEGLLPRGLFVFQPGLPDALRVVGKVKAEASPVTNEIPVHVLVETRLLPRHLPITGAGRGVAPQGTVYTQRGSALGVPPTTFESGRFVRVNACGAEVDEVPREGAFQGPALKPTEVGVVGDLHGPKIAIARKILIKAPAPPALDASVHFMLHKGTEVLVRIGALLPEVAPDSVAGGDGFVLQEAVAPLVADRAVVGMVEHEAFNDPFSKGHSLWIRCGNHHAVLGFDHAAHFDAFDRPLFEAHGTHTASTQGAEGLVETKPGDHDTEPLGGLDHLSPLWNLHFTSIDHQFNHGSHPCFSCRGAPFDLKGHPFWLMCSFTSSMKCSKRPLRGAAAPGAKAQ